MYAIPNTKLINAKRVSKGLTEARKAWTSLPEFPGDLPTSLNEAYGIQSLSIAAWPEPVIGWKVGGIPEKFSHFGDKSLVGPIFPSNLYFYEGVPLLIPVITNGFAAVEAEIIIKTKVDLKPDQYKALAIEDLIDSVYIGVEIASSPIVLINEIGPMCSVSDFGNNAGQIIGREIKDWRERDFSDFVISVSIDEERVGQKAVGSFEAGPLTAFKFLVQSCSQRGIDLPAGSFITTGAVSGVHETHIGAKSKVNFGDFGDIEFEFVTATL